MLKEAFVPQIFSAPRTKIIRTLGVKQASLKRKALVLGLAALNVILLFTYILGVNNYASTGYEIKALQDRISAISQENKKLTLEMAERTAVDSFESELTQSGFTVVKAVKFLNIETDQFSQK